MVISSDLFRLIKSLTSREKAYFKKYSGLHVIGSGNNYIRLFDFIERMDIYDEAKVLEYFKGEKFTRQLSVAKNYLYGAVLRSLRSYRRSARKIDELKELLEDVNVLFEKRLYAQAKKILRRCRKIAQSYEIHSQLLQVLVAETKIAIAEKAYDEKNDIIMSRNYEERKKVIMIIENAFEFDQLEYNITSQIIRHSDSNDRTYIKAVENILSSSMLSDEKNALSLTARLKFNHIYSTYHFAVGNMAESYKYLDREIAILSEKRELLEDRLVDYFILLTNRLVLSMELNDIEGFYLNLEHINIELKRKEAASNERLRFNVVTASSIIEMSFRNKIGEFSKSLEVFSALQRRLSEFSFPPAKNDEYHLNEQASKAYFGSGDYQNALVYINKILNDAHASERYANFTLAGLYRLIIHYELGNIDLLEHSIRSAYRQSIIKGKLYRFEKLIFRFLQKLPDAISQVELNGKFRELSFQLIKYGEDNSVKDALKYFDFFSWLKAKIEGRSYGEIIRNLSNPA